MKNGIELPGLQIIFAELNPIKKQTERIKRKKKKEEAIEEVFGAEDLISAMGKWKKRN